MLKKRKLSSRCREGELWRFLEDVEYGSLELRPITNRVLPLQMGSRVGNSPLPRGWGLAAPRVIDSDPALRRARMGQGAGLEKVQLLLNSIH
jgi:hypothetical protein